MNNDKSATILQFKPKTTKKDVIQDERFYCEYVSIMHFVRLVASELSLEESAIQSMVEAKFGISSIGQLRVDDYKAATQYLVNLHSHQKYGREVTPEDNKVIDTINSHIYDAWKMWRNYFNRTPEQAAELMINAIKAHVEDDRAACVTQGR